MSEPESPQPHGAAVTILLMSEPLLITELALSDIPLLNGETGGPEDMADTEDPFLFRASGELVTFRTVFGWS